MRGALLAGISAVLMFSAPASALTAKEKMDICKFGAADQKLTGKKEQDFIKKCMANEPAAPPTPAGQQQKK